MDRTQTLLDDLKRTFLAQERLKAAQHRNRVRQMRALRGLRRVGCPSSLIGYAIAPILGFGKSVREITLVMGRLQQRWSRYKFLVTSCPDDFD